MPRTLTTERTAASNRVMARDMQASLSFNGTSIKVVLSQTSGLPIYRTTGYSVAGRFKFSQNTGQARAMYADGNSANTQSGFEIILESAGTSRKRLQGFIRNDAGTVALNLVTSTSSVMAGDWNTFVWTDNNGTAQLYINGALDATNFNYTPPTGLTLNTSSIGVWERSVPTNFFLGSLSEFMTFNRVLTAAEAMAFHQGTLSPTGAVSYHKLDEGAGSVAVDSSGNGNNGTITSGTFTIDTPTKARQPVNKNLIYNGDFSYIPVSNIPMTGVGGTWMDGTNAGSATNTLFGWALYSWSGTRSAVFDPSTSYSSPASLKLSVNTNSNIGVATSQSGINLMTIAPSTSYTVRIRIKTTATSGLATTGVRARFVERNSVNGTVATNTIITGIVTTIDWTQYTMTVTTNVNTRYGLVECYIGSNDGAATLIMDAWYDDLELRPTTPVGRGVVS